MTSELIDLLDRQASFVRRQTDPAEFLLGVVRFIAFLRSDPRLETHVEDIERDGTVWSEAQLAHENDVVPELMRLRDILVQLAPELDDSAMPEPAFEQDDSAWDFSFALFDRLAAGKRERTNSIRVDYGAGGDESTPRRLIDILRAKASRGPGCARPDRPSLG